jgi:MFS family permease
MVKYKIDSEEHPMRLYYGWVIVAAGGVMGCVAIGTLFSLAVFLQPMSAATGWSRTGISTAMTLDFVTMGVAAFGWGALLDRIGPRLVVLAGAILLGLGLFLASRATSCWNSRSSTACWWVPPPRRSSCR